MFANIEEMKKKIIYIVHLYSHDSSSVNLPEIGWSLLVLVPISIIVAVTQQSSNCSFCLYRNSRETGTNLQKLVYRLVLPCHAVWGQLSCTLLIQNESTRDRAYPPPGTYAGISRLSMLDVNLLPSGLELYLKDFKHLLKSRLLSPSMQWFLCHFGSGRILILACTFDLMIIS